MIYGEEIYLASKILEMMYSVFECLFDMSSDISGWPLYSTDKEARNRVGTTLKI